MCFRCPIAARFPAHRFVRAIAALLLSAATLVCPARAAERALIPRELFFGNPPRTSPQYSPDGRSLSWLAPDSQGVQNVWVQPAGGTARVLTREGHRPVFVYHWSADGRWLLYLQDGDGDENDHLFAAELASGQVRDLTPYPGVRAQNVVISRSDPGHVLVALNRRDPRAFDLHRVDLVSGEVALEAENPGDVLSWTPDAEGRIRAATAFDNTTQSTVIRVRDAVGAPWRDLIVVPFDEALFDGQHTGGSLVAGFTRDGSGLLVHLPDPAGYGRIERVNVTSGEHEAVLASLPGADVVEGFGKSLVFDATGHQLAAVLFDPGFPQWVFLDPEYERDFARIARAIPGHVEIESRDASGQRWVVAVRRSNAPTVFATYDRKTRSVERLYSEQPALAKQSLSTKQLARIRARDGLELISYLSLPPGRSRGLPMVLLVHGGPWYRDDDSFDSSVQFLTDRGYAVLQVNYRGSTGFGLRTYRAGDLEWGRGMQEDLYDAVRWAIAEGIADPKRIASMGWSGGGYATLMAMWQQPGMFACGVDIVGPGDVRTLFQSFPSYWVSNLARWRRRVGDVEHDDELWRRLSPRFHVDAIRAPLFVAQGAHDPRVRIENADAMVKALRDAGREVTYLVCPDEGHGFARPENNLDLFGRIEEFLAARLGGRAEPRRPVPGSSAELR